jgi:hypothetical protein
MLDGRRTDEVRVLDVPVADRLDLDADVVALEERA